MQKITGIAITLIIFFTLINFFNYSDNNNDAKLVFEQKNIISPPIATLPLHTYANVTPDPELINLVWNKWDTTNFTILSIDEKQGEYLYQNLEDIKKWSLNRWGFNDLDFSAECRFLCAPNKKIFKKLFGIENSKSEVRKENGKIKLNVIWMVFDELPIDSIPNNLGMIYLREMEQKNNLKFGFWFIRGSSILNNSTGKVRNTLSNGVIAFTLKDLINFTEEDWNKLELIKKNQFDFQSACLCLMLRKEFGQNNMHSFVKNSNSKIIGFNSDEDLNLTLIRFCNNLVNDIKNNKTPDNYLNIIAKKER